MGLASALDDKGADVCGMKVTVATRSKQEVEIKGASECYYNDEDEQVAVSRRLVGDGLGMMILAWY